MRTDFEMVKSQINIEDVARYLLGESAHRMYFYPGEKTASIKIYSTTQTFYDFGRGVGGDAIKLWSFVKGCNAWEALQALKSLYGVESDRPNKESIKEQIRQQNNRKIAEAKRKAEWREEVTFWEHISKSCNLMIRSKKVFSDDWCYCINQKQIADYRLDRLCGIAVGEGLI